MDLSGNVFFYVKVFLVTLLIMGLIDFIWLGLVAKGFYAGQLGNLGGNSSGNISFRIAPALITYLVLALGFTVFILPRIPAGSLSYQSFIWGAIFGMVVYGVYDLTNLATLPQWSLTMTIVDILWGMFIYGTTSLIMGFLVRFLQ